jgi:hypothetical protein
MNTRFPTALVIAVLLLICAAAVTCWPGEQNPEPVTAIEKLTNEVLVLKIANGEKDLVLLQQQYQAVTQQIGALRQEQAAHASRVLEAHKAAKGATVNWQAGIIQPPAPEPPAPPKPAKKDSPSAPVTPAP